MWDFLGRPLSPATNMQFSCSYIKIFFSRFDIDEDLRSMLINVGEKEY